MSTWPSPTYSASSRRTLLDEDDEDDDSPPAPPSPPNITGLVVGIVIAGVVILLVLSLLFIYCKKKRRRRDEENYHERPSPPPGPQNGAYGGQQYHRQEHPPSRAGNVTYPKPSPPPVPLTPQMSYDYSSTTPNSTTEPLMISSGCSGSNYSGGEILPPPWPGIALGLSKSTFTYEELARATEGFSNANLLGQGGFGYVHKGILPNGKEVAVKQLKAGSGQGEREFHAEVEIISRIHHKHLVSFVGYCITGSQRMLVYEFVPNNTLEFHLHGKGRPTMDWPTRMKIAVGSAKGLAYLHEDCHPKIIHRDIKGANILLDFKFEAKARARLTRALDDKNFDSLADPRLQNEYNHNEMARMVACAAACVRHSARIRPRMSQIVRALEGDASLSDLNEGIKPGYSSIYGYGSSDYDAIQYNEEMKRFRKTALGSTEYGASSELSNPTSGYGPYPSGSSSEGRDGATIGQGGAAAPPKLLKNV
ncbi:hypothetical protein SLEP1_g22984 [Rubroshorea leprosula]|uniref:non-specific serine/threonine protein kinase n=1 Tax=Rubroshorea leprosula TaxID=152421 RepID=A0AAV5JH25_9ROSI|nr:hypothetical protein SLEP1_g22984 [Rubroshorea leprosula]